MAKEHETTEPTSEAVISVSEVSEIVATQEPEEGSVPSHSPVPVIPQLSVALFILFSMFGVSLFVAEDATPAAPIPENTSLPASAEQTIPVETTGVDPFAEIEIVAESAFVWDVAKQRALYTKDPDVQLPLASITKLMTALVAYELLDDTDSVDISGEAIREMGNSGFTEGERFSFKNLTDLTLIGSSNDGARALAAAAGGSITTARDADTLFIDAMNLRAEEIGLSQTYFNNATGLDVSETEAGGYGSARDITFLMEYIVTRYPALLDETTEESAIIPNEDGEGHVVKNTNNAIREIPGLIASKTGYTDLAGGNLVIVFEAGLNRPIIITVLGSTYSDRFSDVVALAERARETLSQ